MNTRTTIARQVTAERTLLRRRFLATRRAICGRSAAYKSATTRNATLTAAVSCVMGFASRSSRKAAIRGAPMLQNHPFTFAVAGHAPAESGERETQTARYIALGRMPV